MWDCTVFEAGALRKWLLGKKGRGGDGETNVSPASMVWSVSRVEAIWDSRAEMVVLRVFFLGRLVLCGSVDVWEGCGRRVL